jgi:predicted DNA-binding transcriptional regulator AlpA
MNNSQPRERESLAGHQIQTLLNEYDVAGMLKVSVASARRWRLFGHGPKYIKLGASVRYKPEDISAWLESRPTGGELPKEAR